jgi:hypothetical protein
VLTVAGPTSGAFMRPGRAVRERGATRRLVRAARGGRRDGSRPRSPRRRARSRPRGACYPPCSSRPGSSARSRRLTGPHPLYRSAADAAAALAVALLAWRAVRIARRAAAPRGPSRAAPPRRIRVATRAPARAAARGQGARVVGGAVVALALALTVHGAVWSARNVEVLRPIARGQLAPDFSLARIDGTPGDDRHRRAARPGGRARLLGHLVRAVRPDDSGARRGFTQTWAPRGVSFVAHQLRRRRRDARRHQGVHGRAPDSYPVVRDADGEVGARYRLEALPTSS